MKVLSAPVWWIFICKACKAKCQAEPSDVTGIPNTDCDKDVIGTIPVVKCGRCGKPREVPERLITDLIMKIAERKRKDCSEEQD